MTLTEDDIITIDAHKYTVNSVVIDGYWLREQQSPVYSYHFFKSHEQIEELILNGRLKVVGRENPGIRQCQYHQWKKYVGATEVYNYCQLCNAKEHKDWRLIRDEKEY